MVKDDSDVRLVDAINSNNWNEIYNLSENLELHALRQRAYLFQDIMVTV